MPVDKEDEDDKCDGGFGEEKLTPLITEAMGWLRSTIWFLPWIILAFRKQVPARMVTATARTRRAKRATISP